MTELSRSAQIEFIVSQRAPLAKRIQTTQQALQDVTEQLDAVRVKRDQLVSQIEDVEVIGQLRDLDFSALKGKFLLERDSLERLHRRYSRLTLNLGVIGRARQGKSRLLQSLSGLASEHIPDGDRQHCTGVRSIIYHNPEVEPYADVTFYTERLFLDEVIAPYYLQLRLGPLPISIAEWRAKALPPLPADDFSQYAEPRAKYEHLRRYYDHIDAYLPLLHTPSPRRIIPSDIRAYVAQDTSDGQRVYFNYLAVREVKIVCQFPHADVGCIAMIDLPGLGDTGIGDQERLLQALSQDVDFILFVRMPKSSGDYWAEVDVQLYDLAHKALVELPLDQWSFMVLNRTQTGTKYGDNQPNCEDLRDSMRDKHINVANFAITDCSQPADISEKVLDNVLAYLIGHIRELDERYARVCQERLDSLVVETHALCARAQKALGIATGAVGEYPLFQRLFRNVWRDLTGGMESLLRSLREQRQNPSQIFERRVQEVLKRCREDHGLPSIADIEVRRDSVGSYAIAYNEYLHAVRTHLTHHFLDLDDALRDILSQVRGQVTAILENQGRLGALSDAQGEAFIQALATILPEGLPHIKQACTVLAEFQLSYRGFIQYRVRKSLDQLIPDAASLHISEDSSANEVYDYLHTLHGETLYLLQQEFEDWLSDPNAAAFAIVEEFVDQILRSEAAYDEWELFYYQMRAEIWATEFQKLGEKSYLRQQWTATVGNLADAAAGPALTFLR